MSDIRAFFGKKVEKKSLPSPAATAAAPAVAAPPVTTKRAKERQELLLDSDDDFVEKEVKQRKRLKSKSSKETPPAVAPPVTAERESGSSKRKAAIDLSEDDPGEQPEAAVPDDSQASMATTAPADSQSSDFLTPQSPKKVLPVIGRKSGKQASSTAAGRVEIKGSVNLFFGEPEPAKRVPPVVPPKKIQKVVHSDEEEGEEEDDSDASPKKELKRKSKSIPPKGKTTVPPPAVVKIPENIVLASIPPQGRENCLDGYKIAFTGVMGEYLSRPDLEAMVLQYGGKVAQSISGKTTFLVASPTLEDGRDSASSTKYRTAIDRKVKIITEKDFLGLIQASIGVPAGESEEVSLSRSSSTPSVSRIVKSLGPRLEHTSSTSSSTTSPDVSQLLWVDKYKPKRLEDVIGAAESIRKILDWLKKWPEVHIRKTVKIPFTKENPGAKSLLLSGPPGIGKTTLATLVAKSLGYEVLEFNASDVRSKNAIVAQVSDVVHSQALGVDGKLRRRLVIMDEVDGMGGSDRGGIPELIKVIKSSSTPIICICNDRQERKIRSLANHCFDIRLRRPTKKMIADRLVRIGQQEGLMIEPNAAELLVEQMGNDIRQVINASQMWRAQSGTMKYRDLVGSVGGVMPYVDSEEGDPGNETAGRLRGIQKDKILRQSPFDACGLILGGRKTDFHERYNSFFIDYSLLPLLVEQNYIDSARNGIFKSSETDATKMEQLSRAADAISDMDMAGSALRGQDMHWELLPMQAALSLKVGDHVQGFQGFPTFPQWLGKYSTTNKSKRLTQEIVVHTNLSIRQSFDPIRLEYIPYLRHHLISLLLRGTKDGESSTAIEDVISILDEYGLSRDDLMETMKEMQFLVDNDKNLFDRYTTLDTKLKTAFTKKYNSMSHQSQALIEEYQASKRRARGKVGAGESVEDGEDLETTEDLEAAREVQEENSDDDEADLKEFMKKHSKKSSSAGRKTSSSEAKSTSRSRKK